jgi:hypothetical protein
MPKYHALQRQLSGGELGLIMIFCLMFLLLWAPVSLATLQDQTPNLSALALTIIATTTTTTTSHLYLPWQHTA